MITNWVITGDTHGQNSIRLGNIARNKGTENPEETAVIILGDAGYNFYLNKTDKKGKQNTHGMWVYCVRGNHEERPENLGYEIVWDENVKGYVYLDPVNNKIRYFIDGDEYLIDNHPTLVIGGAYSVDKWYRIRRAEAAGQSFTGWFKDEQLTETERNEIMQLRKGGHYDLVLSHTCPISWEPTDLFLNGIDQSQVDKTMEIWLDELKNSIYFDIWMFGHYHGDQLVRPGVEMFFNDYEPLKDIWHRWHTTNHDNDPEWWMEKSPNYHMGR